MKPVVIPGPEESPPSMDRSASAVRPTLLVLTSSFPRWEGDHLPSFVFELSRRLTDSFDVIVLAPHCRGARRSERLAGLEVRRFVYWPGGRDLFAGSAILPTLRKQPWLWLAVPLFVLSQFISIARIMQSRSVRVIHAHWILPQGLLAVVVKMLFRRAVRLVVTSHGADIFGLKTLEGLKRFVLERCDGVTMVSHAIRREAERLGCAGIPMEVMPMGVDTALFHPASRDERLRRELAPNGPLVLFVGRLSEKKGVRYLLEAMPRVLEALPELTLLIVGEGEERGALEALARSLGILGSRVIFCGGVPHASLPRFYATADVFVGPSVVAGGGDAEGFGLVFVEALACGCPVIATDLPAIADIVIPGENGLIVEQRNAPAIASALLGLLGDRARLDQIRSGARQSVVDRYDWQIIHRRYRALLLESR